MQGTHQPFNAWKDSVWFSSAAATSVTPLPGAAYYWHNIGDAGDAWWGYLVGSVPVSPITPVMKVTRCYAATSRAMLWWPTRVGMVPLGGGGWVPPIPTACCHLVIRTIVCMVIICIAGPLPGAVAPSLAQAIPPSVVKKRFGLFHPIPTQVRFNPAKGQRLIDLLPQTFGDCTSLPPT